MDKEREALFEAFKLAQDHAAAAHEAARNLVAMLARPANDRAMRLARTMMKAEEAAEVTCRAINTAFVEATR